jgi:NAD(P)-dependent dehydrogenase (short-subunit alcohol dehydrogenase family)
MRDHWLIIGGSSAIARSFARTVAQGGAAVTLAGRDLADLEATAADARLRGAELARALSCNVTDSSSRATLVAAAPLPDTRLNVFLAVGDMPEQSAMDRDADLLVGMINASYAGPVALLQGLAPLLERQSGGRVIVLGSVAGDRGRRKNYLYGSAKAGLAVHAEGLRARLFPHGASVTVVKPGFIDTAMTWGLPGLFLVATPQACASAALKAAERGRAVVYHPGFWRLIMLMIRLLPAAIMKRLNF